MSVKKKSNKDLRGKWLFKYRVVIMNENTLEDVATFRLNRLNVFIYSSLFAILMIVLTSFRRLTCVSKSSILPSVLTLYNSVLGAMMPIFPPYRRYLLEISIQTR